MSTPRFLEMVANKVLSHALPTEQITVVLPNRRAGVFLSYALSKKIEKPILLPNIITIEEYFYQLSELQPIESTEQLFLLFESVKAVGYETDFDAFLNWGPTLLTDFNDIDSNVVETGEFFHNLYHDKELRNWTPNEELSKKQVKYLSLWQAAEKIYTHFTDTLIENGQAYTGLAYRIAINKLKIDHLPAETPHLFFCGFNALNGAEEELFRHHYRNNSAIFLWDYDDYYVNDEYNKAGHYFRMYDRDWPGLTLPSRVNIGSHKQYIECIAASNTLSQCSAAGSILHHLSESGKLDNNTAIILADENLLQPLLFHLPKGATDVNITMGKALTEFEIFHFFDQYLFLHQIAAEQGKFSAGVLQSLLATVELRQNYPEDVRLVNTYIIKQNRAFLSAGELLAIVRSKEFWSHIFIQKITGQQAVDQCDQLIEYWREAMLESGEKINLQFLFELRKIFNLTADLIHKYQPDVTLKTLRSLIQQLCRTTKLPFEGEPLQGLQIMGMLESRCLDFENLIVVSANEGVLPRGRGGHSFIPEIFKERYGIQGYKAKDAIYAYSFYRLLHHCKHAYFVYNVQNDHLGGGEMSRFLKQLESEYPTKLIRSNLELSDASYPKLDEIEKNTQIIDKLYYYLTEVGVSASALSLYIKNPLDFYYKYIIGLMVPDVLETDIEHSSFGTLVHKTLENIYHPFLGKKLDEQAIQQLKTTFRKDFLDRYNAQFGGGELSGMNYLMRQAGLKLIEECIKLDENRIKHEAIVIRGLELRKPCVLSILTEDGKLALKLTGSIDRLQLANETIEVLDYKTGKARNLTLGKMHNLPEKPELNQLLQLMVYATMAFENGDARDGLYAGITSLISYKRGIQYITGSNKEKVLITPEIISLFKKQLELIVKEMLNPDIPFALRGEKDEIKYSDFIDIYG